MKYTYIFILGSHPKLSLAELDALLPDTVEHRGQVGWYETENAVDANALMNQLGGTIKIAQLIGDGEFNEEALTEWLYEKREEGSKFHFGFSLYALDSGIQTKKHWKTLHKMGLNLKKALRADDISARYVQANEIVLSSVIVHKERLLKNGAEILLLKDHDTIYMAHTLAVQPFQDFSKRDYGRPGRDAQSGMLPPKLARMMVNIAAPEKQHLVYDPFCGSGTILQEAWLLGYRNITGSDISEKAVQDTEDNLKWIKAHGIDVDVCDARKLNGKGIKNDSVDRFIFEGYLGPPTPRGREIPQIKNELQQLYSGVFQELARALATDGRIVAAIPFWRQRKEDVFHLDIDSLLKKAGLHEVHDRLYYRRPKATVGREILILEK